MADDLNINDPSWDGHPSEYAIRMVHSRTRDDLSRAVIAASRQMYRYFLAWPPDGPGGWSELTSPEACRVAIASLLKRDMISGYSMLLNRTETCAAFVEQIEPYRVGRRPELQDWESRVGDARSALINAELRVGGRLGVTRDEMGLLDLAIAGLTGPSGCLTARGLRIAKVMQHRYYDERTSLYGV